MKVIRATKFKISGLKRKVIQEVKRASDNTQRDFDRTAIHFNTVHPDFNIRVENGGLTGVVVTPEDRAGNIWHFLNAGTRVRYATMSPDFQAKTTPETFDTMVGEGQLYYVNVRDPKPGIEARNFTGLAAKTHGKVMQDNIIGLIYRMI